MSIKIAITGGPSGGKTTLIEALKKEFGKQIKVAPEAATILYGGGFPRIKNYSGFFHAQKAIVATQREIEDLLVANYPNTVMICDRGSLDSLAYWPDTEEHFFKTIGTTREKELARYNCVIHLDTAFEADYDHNNPVRTENFQEALILNDKVKAGWSGHPNRIILSAENDFVAKMAKATAIISEMIK